MTEQNKKDVLDMYREGYSRKEIIEEFEGLDPTEIQNICDEEDHSWDIE